MDYLLFAMIFAVGTVSVVNRLMIRKIYDAGGRSLSRFSLPMVIRKEYRARFGKDTLYWISEGGNVLFGAIILLGVIRLLR